MEKKEPLKIDKKIVSYKVITEAELPPVELPTDKENYTHEEVFGDLKDFDKNSSVEYLTRGENLYYVKKELKRPRKLTSETYRLKPPHYEHAIYVHISDIVHEGKKYPFEIFFNCKNPENIMWVSTITLLLSETFREAITGNNNLKKVINNLKQVCDASGGYFATVGAKKKHVGSIMAEIGYILEKHIEECNAWNYSQSSHESPATEEEKSSLKYFDSPFHATHSKEEADKLCAEVDSSISSDVITNPCPDCGDSMRISEGCLVCTCGYSKCG